MITVTGAPVLPLCKLSAVTISVLPGLRIVKRFWRNSSGSVSRSRSCRDTSPARALPSKGRYIQCVPCWSMEESVKACSPEIRPRIAMGVEPISIPLRKTTARSSEALRMMETGPVGAFSGCQVVENALSNDEDELPLPSSTSGAGAKRGISADWVMITVNLDL